MPPHEMGVVCGVQNSVQALSETASFVAGTLLTDPSQVGMPLMSLAHSGLILSKVYSSSVPYSYLSAVLSLFFCGLSGLH